MQLIVAVSLLIADLIYETNYDFASRAGDPIARFFLRSVSKVDVLSSLEIL